ncbi:hypothetical protein M1L60_13840 [Actinoplanes sp. TRM 88003]|uniref:Uncharacterized protein n=1 Tax=Paractinoplanes aksuensis TaxID=2939490 RepID=A0ABT1DLF4_9ACTN|nr:hypothetical protein [Actinoplanes aksuensis]MCO8271673.1 hypothetical protein [Actinoplanes aksuensis]
MRPRAARGITLGLHRQPPPRARSWPPTPTTPPATTPPPSTPPPTTTPPSGPVKAFPSAVGFGAAATGGRGDGLPDAWETKYGLNPSTNDANGDFDQTGYPNIEKYINGLLDAQYP